MTNEEFIHEIENKGGEKAALAFIAYGGDIHIPLPGPGIPPMHYAVEAENIPMVNALFNLGADIDALDKDGLTPLHHAVSLDIDTACQTTSYRVDDFMSKLTFPLTECVVSLGANTSIRTPEGCTARDLAALFNDDRILARYDEVVERAQSTL